MSKKVFITGMGIVSSIGNNVEEHKAALSELKTGFGKVDFFETIYRHELPVFEIKKSAAELGVLAGVDEQNGYSRTALLAIIAVSEALKNAHITDLHSAKTGLLSSTTVGGMREFELLLPDLLNFEKEGTFRNFQHGTDAGEHTERIADLFGFRDYIGTLSTACSSASNAIIHGAELIKHGILDRAICGGSDALSLFTLNGFHSLKILDKVHCRPFDAERSGVNLGEGAAYLVLESEEMIRKSGHKPLAVLSGYSNTNDAFHQTASSPDGSGAIRSMQNALTMACLKPEDLSYINCHGTATENNDLSECMAIQRLFGEYAVPFSSTKPFTGHTLAAAGSVEAVFSILAINESMIFPNLNFKTKMEEINIIPCTELIRNKPIQHVLSNSFGFGGSNTSLIFSKV